MTLAYEPMEMTGLINITQEISTSGAVLRKASGRTSVFDSTASSSEFIESLQSSRRGLRCRLLDADGNRDFFYIGLTSGAAGLEQQHLQQEIVRESVNPCKSITYGICVCSGSFYVFECGKQIGEFGEAKAGDIVEIRLTTEELPKVEYFVNETIVYTSSKSTAGQVPLFVKVCAGYQAPLMEELQWILEPPPLTRITEQQKQQTRTAQQQTQVTDLQTQCSQGEKKRLKAGAEEREASLKAEVEAWPAGIKRQRRDMKEQSEAERAAFHVASCAVADEKLDWQTHAMQLQSENAQLRAENQELRRCRTRWTTLLLAVVVLMFVELHRQLLHISFTIREA